MAALLVPEVLEALIEKDKGALPQLLADMGVFKRSNRQPLPIELIEPIADVAVQIVGDVPYRFARDTDLYDILFELQSTRFSEINDTNLPPAMVFVNRTLGGLFGNLCRLQAQAQWKAILGPVVASPS